MRASTPQAFDRLAARATWLRTTDIPTSAGSPRCQPSASEGSMGAAAILLTRRKRRASHSIALSEIDVCGTAPRRRAVYRLKMPREASVASSRSIPSASAVHFRAIDKACVRRFSGIWTDLPSTRLFLAYTRHRADVSMAASPLWKAGARSTLCHR
jgi:hypothetical protein